MIGGNMVNASIITNVDILMKSAYNPWYSWWVFHILYNLLDWYNCFPYIPTSYTVPVVLNVRVMTQTRRPARFWVGLFKNRTRKGLIELQLRYRWLATQRSLVTGGCCDSASTHAQTRRQVITAWAALLSFRPVNAANLPSHTCPRHTLFESVLRKTVLSEWGGGER